MELSRGPMAEEVVNVEELALARILEDCLNGMSRGETDLDALASRYPDARDEIRPLLDIASLLGERSAAAPAYPLQLFDDLKQRLLSQHSAA
ncbi:MAG: hypothetical protein WD379_07380 [Dehalococcoidia bacterium]